MSPAPNPHVVAFPTIVTIEELDGDSFGYLEQSDARLIVQDSSVKVTADPPIFTDMVLTVSIDGMSASQILSVNHEGVGPDQIGFQDGTVFFSGMPIGEVTGGEGEPLTIVLSTNDADAVAAILHNLTYEDTSDAPEASSDITIAFSDDEGVLASAAVTVNVFPLDDAPVAEDDGLALGVDDSVTGSLAGNDFDPDDPENGSLNVVSLTDAAGTDHPVPDTGTIEIAGIYGTLTIDATGAFTYTADNAGSVAPGDTVTDVFTYTIADRDGSEATAEVSFSVTAPPLFRFANLDGDALTYPEGSAPLLLDAGADALVEGTLPTLDGIVLIVAADDGSGSEIFSVLGEGSGPGQIDVLDGGIVRYEGAEIGTLSADPGGALSVTFSAGATNTAIAALARRIAYADTSASPSDTVVSFTLLSGATILSVSQVSVTAEPESDDPVAAGDIGTVTAGGSLTDNVIENDSDPDDTQAVLTVTGVNAGADGAHPQVPAGTSVQGTFGTLTLNADGTYVYLANNTAAIPPGGAGQDVFTYSITSSAGGEATAQLAITVENPVQDPLFTFSDFDGDARDYTEQSGAVVIDQDVSALGGQLGWDGIAIHVDLGGAGAGESIGLRHQGMGAGQIGLAGSDVRYSGITVGSITQQSPGSFTILLNGTANDEIVSAILRNVRYANPHEILQSSARTLTVTALLNEQAFGADTATFQIVPVDDPLLAADDPFPVAEEAAVTGNVFTNDVDPDRPPPLGKELVIRGASVGTAAPASQTLTGPLVLGGIYGTLTINPDGSFTYNANLSNDLIAGETGRDVFTYLVRNETGDEAAARVVFTVNGSDESLTGGVSADVLAGGRGADRIDGLGGDDRLTGGDGADLLIGGAGNDTLDGGAGADRMEGGVGNDTYMVDHAQDVVMESQKGKDTIVTTIGFTLSKNLSIELLQGSGLPTSSLQLVGNELGQSVFGSLGADTLDGKGGADILKGDKGHDAFVFDSRGGGADTILDFKPKEDKIHLAGKIFGLRKGKLKADAFVKFKGSPEAQESDDRILYDRSKGYLYADVDGSNGKQPVLVAILKNKPALGAKDFFIL
ncbi:MAG TPA: Ig-like domain-containing protein [Microvirga sp.]|jgi:VCBS repeat-containing protein|nr:Ig-like domain-containing protein [Microvirga sp.]